MKKILFAFALCAMTVAACTKEQEENITTPTGKTVTLHASMEAFSEIDPSGVATKGTLNAAGNFLWATGDQIGVRLYKGTTYDGTDPGSGYGAWDGTFILDDGFDGLSAGDFTCSNSLDEYVHWGYAAFYPKFNNNVSNGDKNVYFELKKVYDGYVSGTCLMPMVANLNIAPDGLNGRPTDINFKHVGAGLRVTLKDVPAAANQVSLTVAGKNIVNGETNTAWYGINPANAGTDAISATDGSDSTVYLKFATAASKRDMTFIFPLPTVDLSGGITIKLYYDNGIDEHAEFWSRTAHPVAPATPLPALTRGQLLDMPDVPVNADPDEVVTLYFRAATPVTTKASLCSSVLGTEAWPGTELTETDFFAGSLWYKFEAPVSKIWDKNVNFYFHGGGWASSETIADFSKHRNAYYFVAEKDLTVRQLSGRPADWSFDSFQIDWKDVTTSAAGRTSTGYDGINLLKVTANSSKVFVYLEMKKSALYDNDDYEYANLLRIYLGDASSTTDHYWQWTSKYTKKFSSWLKKDNKANLITYECDGYQSHVEEHSSLFVSEEVPILYYEISIPRTFDNCLKGTSATIAIEANKQYVEGGTWKGEETQIGFAPNTGGTALSFTLPTYE